MQKLHKKAKKNLLAFLLFNFNVLIITLKLCYNLTTD